MCGYRQPLAQMMADGGSACADVRWYCLDTLSCTQRWTRLRGELSRPRAASTVPVPAGGELTAQRRSRSGRAPG
jgi:hypothetical protein